MKKTIHSLFTLGLLLFSTAAFAQNWITGKDGTLLKSNTGGVTWQSIQVPNIGQGNPSDFHFDGIYSRNNQIWVGGGRITGSNSTQKGEIWYSSDTGSTWTMQLQDNRISYSQIGFFSGGNANTGLGLASFFASHARGFRRTTDAGTVWVSDNVKTTYPGLIFPPATTNQAYVITDNEAIEKTTDAGNNFSTVFVPEAFNTIIKGDSYVITAGDKGLIYRSEDGGASWIKLTLPNLGTSTINQINKSMTGDTLLLAADNGYIGRSTDSGQTWAKIPLTETSDMQFVYFVNDTLAFAGGDKTTNPSPANHYNLLYRSTNGGQKLYPHY